MVDALRDRGRSDELEVLTLISFDSARGPMPLFVPTPTECGSPVAWKWYRNIETEVRSGNLGARSRELMRSYYRAAGLLSPWRNGHFKHHFSETFADTCRFVLGGAVEPLILDLGCGVGTQSLYFALMGARVIAVDMSAEALEVLQCRLRIYQTLCDRELKVSVICGNSLHLDYAGLGPIDGVHSMFAFNMMQPSGDLLDRLSPCLSGGARLAIIDGNCMSWIARLFPSRRRDCWSPVQFRSELERRGFEVVRHVGRAAIPPLAWRVLPGAVARSLDAGLNGSWNLAMSHHIFARRCADA